MADTSPDPLEAAAKRGRTMGLWRLSDDYSDDERDFLRAMLAYKTRYGRVNPTCCEVLAVLKSIGFKREQST